MKNAKTYVINRGLDHSERTVRAVRYGLEKEYWVFYADLSQTKTVLTIRASLVDTIDTIQNDQQ